jgi:hypothetical protein
MRPINKSIGAALSALILAVGTGAAADPIGAATLVEPVAERSPPDGDWAVIDLAGPVYLNDQIRAGDAGGLRITFLDESELALGPGSELVIDRFVFDPASGNGEMLASLGSGLFRFASGQIGSEAITVTTPTATLGVRGTVFDVLIDGAGRTVVRVAEGEVSLSALTGQAAQILQAGQAGLIRTAVDQVVEVVEAEEWQEILEAFELLNANVQEGIGKVEQASLQVWDEFAAHADQIEFALALAGLDGEFAEPGRLRGLLDSLGALDALEETGLSIEDQVQTGLGALNQTLGVLGGLDDEVETIDFFR